MTNILITGANGFLGSHVVEHVLATTNWDITALCRVDYAGSMDNLLPLIDEEMPVVVVAASDPSPNIYLYFMHRKGWSATEAVSDSAFADMAARGARVLISGSRALEARPEIARRLEPIGTHGRFNVFRIVAPRAGSPGP